MRRSFPTASSSAALTSAEMHHLPPCAYHRKARCCWPRLAWWLLDMCIINAFQLWSKGQQHPGQLRFREELMHELLKQLPPEQKPQRARACPNPNTALAKDHYPEQTDDIGDCKQCSNRAAARKRSRIICAECGVHLCIGACFSRYHSEL